MDNEAISNSGPIIHLAQIKRFNLLNVFDKVSIPKAVHDEVCIAGMPGDNEIRNSEFINIFDVSDNDIEVINKSIDVILDAGETHALALCKKTDTNIFLTDDLDAREAGTSLGLEVHGSVGVIAKAYRYGLINLDEAETAMDDLYNKSDLFIARAIIDSVLKEIIEY